MNLTGPVPAVVSSVSVSVVATGVITLSSVLSSMWPVPVSAAVAPVGLAATVSDSIVCDSRSSAESVGAPPELVLALDGDFRSGVAVSATVVGVVVCVSSGVSELYACLSLSD